jgi:hypothetical protein
MAETPPVREPSGPRCGRAWASWPIPGWAGRWHARPYAADGQGEAGKDGHKPGGQPGSPGSRLAWNADLGQTVAHFPDGACACGVALAGALTWPWPPATSRWTSRWPPPASPSMTCTRWRVAAALRTLAGAAGTVTYGQNLQA